MCRSCAAPVPDTSAVPYCGRCTAHRRLERVTQNWSPGGREAIWKVIYEVVRQLPPEEAAEVFDLMGVICRAEH